MGSLFKIIVEFLLCIHLLIKDSSSVPENRFVEIHTGHLTIPVPYRPDEYYRFGIPIMQRRPNTGGDIPEETIRSSEHPPVEQGVQHRQHGRSIIGRSMGGPPVPPHSNSSKEIEKMSNNTTNTKARTTSILGGEVEEDVHGLSQPSSKLSISRPHSRLLAQMSVGGKYIPEPPDSEAKHGDACSPTGALDWDYCEMAKYPNKGRMVCATIDIDPDHPGKCVCKFAKINATSWVQMNYQASLNLCRSPNGGVCYVKFHTDEYADAEKLQPIYRRNRTLAHDQCDDDEPLNSKKRKLFCVKPHPRKFASYNAYHYYCLPKSDRLDGDPYLGPNLGSTPEVNIFAIAFMLWITLLVS